MILSFGLFLLFFIVQSVDDVPKDIINSTTSESDSSDDETLRVEHVRQSLSFSASSYHDMHLQITFDQFPDCLKIYRDKFPMNFQSTMVGSNFGERIDEKIIMFVKPRTFSTTYDARMKVRQFVTELSIHNLNDKTLYIPNMPIILPLEFHTMTNYCPKPANADVIVRIYDKTDKLECVGVARLSMKLEIYPTSPFSVPSPLKPQSSPANHRRHSTSS